MLTDRKCKNPDTKGDEIARLEQKISKQESILKDLENKSTIKKVLLKNKTKSNYELIILKKKLMNFMI